VLKSYFERGSGLFEHVKNFLLSVKLAGGLFAVSEETLARLVFRWCFGLPDVILGECN
jgi:hypothetical protein